MRLLFRSLISGRFGRLYIQDNLLLNILHVLVKNIRRLSLIPSPSSVRYRIWRTRLKCPVFGAPEYGWLTCALLVAVPRGLPMDYSRGLPMVYLRVTRSLLVTGLLFAY